MRYRRLTAFAFTASLIVGVAPVSAHMGATGVVKVRMDAMKSMAAAMKRIHDMVRGEQPFDGMAVATAADEVARHAGRMTDLFPKGSHGGMSEAGTRIWSERAAFAERADELAQAAAALADAGKQGDRRAAEQHYRSVGTSCSACHKDYRVKKTH